MSNEIVKVQNNEGIFWLDDYQGKAIGGYYVRCNLKQHIEQFKKQGFKVVGIKVCEDSNWNLQFICEKIEEVENETHIRKPIRI